MLSIEEVKRTIENLKKAEQHVVSLNAEMAMVKKQAREIFDKYGLKGFSDVPKLQEKLHAVEAELTQEQEQAEQYITEVNKVKERVENTLVG